MIRPIHCIFNTVKQNTRRNSFSRSIPVLLCVAFTSLFISNTVHAQVIVETFEEAPWTAATTLSTGSTMNTGAATTTVVGAQWGSAAVTVGASSSTIPITVNTSTTLFTASGSGTASGSSGGTSSSTTSSSYNETTSTTSFTTGAFATTTGGPDSTGTLVWAYSYTGVGANQISVVATSRSHSNTDALIMPSQSSYLITPIVNGGITKVTFWVQTAGGSADPVYVGLRTNFTNTLPIYPTGIAGTGGALNLFSNNSSSISPVSGASISTGTATSVLSTLSTWTHIQSPGHLTSTNFGGNSGSGSTSYGPGGAIMSFVSYTISAASLETVPGQIVFISNGSTGTPVIDDISIFESVSITLGSNPSTCYSSSAQTANLTYSTTSGHPLTYSISGWSGGGFSNVTNVALPASPIPITVPGLTAPGTYTATLTVADDEGVVSPNYPISVTVNSGAGISTVPSSATYYYKFNGDVKDTTNTNNGTYQTGGPAATYTTDRYGNASSAITLNSPTNSEFVSTAVSVAGGDPTTFSESIWFKTTSPNGSLIGTAVTTTTFAGNHDREIYLSAGKVVFTIWNTATGKADSVCKTTGTYNDGTWHMATATVSPATGLTLYVDGIFIANEPAANYTLQTYSPATAYFRMGASFMTDSNWPGSVGGAVGTAYTYFSGSLDDAVISTTAAFADTDVTKLYTGNTVSSNSPVCVGSTLNLRQALSGTGYTYAWSGPASFSQTGQTTSRSGFVVADSGEYYVTVTAPTGCTLDDSTDVSLYTPLNRYVIPHDDATTSYYNNFGTNANDSFSYDGGTAVAAPTATTDRYNIANAAYTFNGSTQYVSTANSLSAPPNFSVSAWFKTTTANAGVIAEFNSSQDGTSATFSRMLDMVNGTIQFGAYTSGGVHDIIISPLTYNDGDWHLATGTFSATNGMSLYIDGQLVTSNPLFNGALQNIAGYWVIAHGNNSAAWNSPSKFFTGSLSDVVISNATAFSSAEAAELYSSLIPSNNSPLCSGGTLSMTVAVTGATYAWTGPASYGPVTTQTATRSNFISADAGEYYITETAASTGCISEDSIAAVLTTVKPDISVIPSGINTYYTMDSATASPTMPDAAGANTGTLQNGPTLSNDRYNQTDSAYSFDGVNDNMSTTTNFGAAPPTTFTISTWFKTSSLSEMPLIGMGNNHTTNNTVRDRVLYMVNGRVIFYTVTPAVVVDSIGSPLGVSYADNTWHLATATFSAAGGSKLYVDGALVAININYNSAYNGYASSYWRIGNNLKIAGGSQVYFAGSLDDIAIYNTTALTASQVSQLYSGTSTNSSGNDICSGSSLTLSQATTSGATYAWSGPLSYTSASQNATINPLNTANDGTYNITVTNSSTGCSSTGAVTIVADTIALSSAAGTNAQTLCSLGAITNITYTVAGPATGAGIVWSPVAGPGGTVSGNYVANSNGIGGVFTISGTPATTGTYTYTITSTGSSCAVTATGSLGVYSGVTWTGATSNAWNVASNWTCGAVPTYNTSVIIPYVGPGNPQPVLDSSVTISGLTLTGASATLGLGSGNYVLTINGAVSGSGTISSTASSAIVMGSASTGTLNFTSGSNTIDSLSLKDNASTITIGSALNIASTGLLRVGYSTGAKLASGGNITLISDNSGSARVAAVPFNAGTGVSSSTISGNVTVQSYFHSTNSSVSAARRAWRLITAPISDNSASPVSTIYSSWQNGGVFAAGIGTMITVPVAALGTSVDMDAGINSNYSGYTWKISTQTLTTMTDDSKDISGVSGSADNIGYFIFVRGDRTPATINPPYIAYLDNTTLSASGILQLGDQKFTSANSQLSTAVGGLSLIGNPYACSVNFSSLASGGGLSNLYNRYYVWNANIPGAEQVGGYITMDGTGGGGTYVNSFTGTNTSTDINLQIQSGQAFFVQTIASGVASITFRESYKTLGTANNNYIYRPEDDESSSTSELFYTGLCALNSDSSTSLIDGTVAQYGNYCNCVDGQDAPKFTNIDEMLSLSRSGKKISIERRPTIVSSDTLFLTLNQIVQQNYQFKLAATFGEHPGLGAHLEDSYTGIHTPLNLADTNKVNFTIDGNTASKAQNRFMVVFGAVNTPTVYTNLKARQQGNTIVVQWSVSNDQSMKGYVLQRSTDGINYVTVYTTAAQHTTGDYSWTDTNPVAGTDYYRVLSTDMLNEESYSVIVSVAIGSLSQSGITVYPNPINDGVIGVAMNNMPAGIYTYRLLDALGQELQIGTFNHIGGNATDNISVNEAITRGTYQLIIVHPDKTTTAIGVVY